MNFRAAIPVLLLCAAAAQTPPARRVSPTPSRRLALVVGNNAYPRMPLTNAVNDARAVDSALQSLGFSTILLTDSTLRDLDSAVDRFIASIQPGDAALFYYSGHGIQLEGENYLIPTNYAAEDEAEAKYQAYAAGRIHDRMLATGAHLTVLILDACRNNPYHSAKSATRGLAPMTAAKGSLIVFATAPGAEASDLGATKDNGLFTGFLLDALRQPGLSIEPLFSRVRQSVVEASNGKQVPWTGSSLIGDFVFNDPATRSADIRIRLDREEVESLSAAAERQRELQRQMEELAKKNGQQELARKADEARIAELQRQKAAILSESQKSTTLDQARAEVAAIEKRIVDTKADLSARRDRDLRQLSADYEPVLALARQPATKGEFETTPQFNDRKRELAEKLAALEKDFTAKQAGLKTRFDNDVATLTAADLNRLSQMTNEQTFTAPCDLKWQSYDADTETLTLLVQGKETTQIVPLKDAPALKANFGTLRCQVSYSPTGEPMKVVAVVGADGKPAFPAVPPSPPPPATPPVTQQEPSAQPLQTKVNPKDGLTYVWIPPGGGNQGFWLGQTDVTQEAYQRVALKLPFQAFNKGEQRPVVMVSWKDADVHCRAIGGRLPTEKEWEYAARGGTTDETYGDLNEIAWYSKNSHSETHAVAQKKPNALGLYDMLGNVWQWMDDWYDSRKRLKSLRGGSWINDPEGVRVSLRFRFEPVDRVNSVGFRCVGD